MRLSPGGPALCGGTVLHHRRSPAEHRFTYPISMVWIDPDEPAALFDRHPLWSSSRRPGAVWFRRRDYFDGGTQPIGPAVVELTAPRLGYRPTGPVRMLTQPRTFGWLFNPITVYLIWHDPPLAGADPAGSEMPAAAVLEVTNTPWKERAIYAVALEAAARSDPSAGVGATFAKTLHVSPFLDEDYDYQLRVTHSEPDVNASRLRIELDVLPRCIQEPRSNGGEGKASTSQPLLTTRLVVDRTEPTRRAMSTMLYRNPLPTHRVSLGIHRQALALWRKNVPVVAHPDKRSGQTPRTPSHGSSPR